MKRYVVLVLFLLLLAAAACTSPGEPTEPGLELPIYFLVPTEAARGGDALRCSYERLDLWEGSTVEEMATEVVKRLLAGSQDGTLLSPFPKETALISVTIRNTRAYVDFSGIQRMDGINLTLADYCLTLSLTAIAGIDSVSVTGNGRLMVQQPRRIFHAHDVLLSSDDNVLQQVPVRLYFLSSEGVLTAEERMLDIYEGETQSAVLLTALLSGPKDRELINVIPEDFQISSIKVENGVCLIHLPAAYQQTLPEDGDTQNLILWSLAESLYSLEHILEIRLLADGEELEYFGSVPVASIEKRPQG